MAIFEELLRRAKAGDRDALQALLVPHLPGLTGFVRLRTGAALRGRISASDVVQSVCRRALTGLDELRAESEQAFKQWLYATALNRVRDLAERQRAAREVDGEAVPGLARRVGARDLLESYATLETPSGELGAREEVERIEACFDQLPDDYREVLLLARMAGLSYAEIAERTGRSEGAVRQLLHRARARLAMLLG